MHSVTGRKWTASANQVRTMYPESTSPRAQIYNAPSTKLVTSRAGDICFNHFLSEELLIHHRQYLAVQPSPFLIHRSLHKISSRDGISSSTPVPNHRQWADAQWLAKLGREKTDTSGSQLMPSDLDDRRKRRFLCALTCGTESVLCKEKQLDVTFLRHSS